jgi:hypothetical protein
MFKEICDTTYFSRLGESDIPDEIRKKPVFARLEGICVSPAINALNLCDGEDVHGGVGGPEDANFRTLPHRVDGFQVAKLEEHEREVNPWVWGHGIALLAAMLRRSSGCDSGEEGV